MGTNIGIDFGSTYSMISCYNEQKKEPVGIVCDNRRVEIQSLACENPTGRGLVFGDEALKSLCKDPTLESYRAFKMLLHEGEPENYRSHGYKTRTPAEVSEAFLEKFLLKAVSSKLKKKYVDNAVICVPEHWIKRCDQMSGRSILLNICRKIRNRDGEPLLKNIRVISEPVAATAYYAHCYRRAHKNKPFEGDVLIVDYGGGTLDISLTTVKAGKRDNDKMEIDVEFRTGVGENSQGKIGDAGLAYMERVVAIALEKAGIRNVRADGLFLNAKDELEAALMDGAEDLHDYLIQEGYDGDNMELMETNHELFKEVMYGGKVISITYAMLYQAFVEIVYPVLEKYMGEIKREILDKRSEPCKVAIVGGFGKFSMVQFAIWKLLGVAEKTLDLTLDAGGDQQEAVSLGAALIAAGEVQVLVKSPYAMGLKTTGNWFRSAIAYQQEIPDRDEVYPVGGQWKDPLVILESDNTWVFAVNNKKDSDEAIALKPVPWVYRDISNRLRQAKELLQLELKKKIEAFYLGFSMDESCIYYVHFFAADPETEERILNYSVKEELGNFLLLFGPTVSLTPKPNGENVLKREKTEKMS